MRITADWHTHPFHSGRNYEGMRRFAESALEKGLSTIAFTEHAWLSPHLGINAHYFTRAEYESYLECCERCRREYAGVLDVKIGIEADFHPENLEHVARLRDEFAFDHVGGSVHSFGFFWKTLTSGMSSGELMKRSLGWTLEMVRSGLFDAVNHLDFFRWKQDGYDPLPLEDRFREIFEEMARRDMVLELNTSGLRKPFHSFLPCAEVWKWSWDYPLRRIYGSDAHAPEYVAFEIAEAERWLFPEDAEDR